MLRQNMGRLDRTVRFIAAVALIPIGLFALGGWQGSLSGILVEGLAVVLLLTSLTGFCPGYVPFGISTNAGKRVGEAPGAPARSESFADMMEEMADRCRSAKVMPQMMAACCGAQDGEEATVAETGRKV